MNISSLVVAKPFQCRICKQHSFHLANNLICWSVIGGCNCHSVSSQRFVVDCKLANTAADLLAQQAFSSKIDTFFTDLIKTMMVLNDLKMYVGISVFHHPIQSVLDEHNEHSCEHTTKNAWHWLLIRPLWCDVFMIGKPYARALLSI